MGQTIVFTVRTLLFNTPFWQKLTSTATRDDKAGYWLNRLYQKALSAQKEHSSELTKFIEELGEKYGMKGPDGKVMMGHNGLPVARPDAVEAYDKAYDEYTNKKVEVTFHKLPLSYFAHIQKNPLDWEILEQVAIINPETMTESSDTGKTGVGTSTQKISAVN